MSWDHLEAEVSSMFADNSAWQQREFDWQFAAERVREKRREYWRAQMMRLYVQRKRAGTCTKCDAAPVPGQTRCAAHQERNRADCRKAYRRSRANIDLTLPGRRRCGNCGGLGHYARTCGAQMRSAA
jgi:hypothetical protein